jgi:antitoxin component YwqK of YwqJK toxin-antitoxin module
MNKTEELLKIKELLDSGIITEIEFNNMKLKLFNYTKSNDDDIKNVNLPNSDDNEKKSSKNIFLIVTAISVIILIVFSALYNSKDEINKLTITKSKEIENQIVNNSISKVDETSPTYINNKILATYSDVRNRTKISYYDNGVISYLLVYDKNTDNSVDIYNSNNKWESLEFYENGSLKDIGSLIASNRIGERIQYNKNGTIFIKNNYSYGKKNGEEISNYRNGKLEYKCSYNNGAFIGDFISYFENGQLKKKCRYNENSYLIENWITYYDNGNVKVKTFYNNDGNIEGEVLCYYRTGQLLKKMTFENGTQKGHSEYFNIDGISVTVNDIDWNSSNLEFIYFDNGKKYEPNRDNE